MYQKPRTAMSPIPGLMCHRLSPMPLMETYECWTVHQQWCPNKLLHHVKAHSKFSCEFGFLPSLMRNRREFPGFAQQSKRRQRCWGKRKGAERKAGEGQRGGGISWFLNWLLLLVAGIDQASGGEAPRYQRSTQSATEACTSEGTKTKSSGTGTE